jgi:molybdopterin-guanine dinucleotide biosynthesis protein A
VFYDSDGEEPEPLLGIYEPQFWPILQQAVLEGHYSPRKLLQLNDTELLVAPDIRELTNVNDPQARARLGL